MSETARRLDPDTEVTDSASRTGSPNSSSSSIGRGSARLEEADIIDLMLPLARKRNPLALNHFGETYYFGLGKFKQNHIKAAFWYSHAAKRGHAKSQLVLAYMYYEGEGVKQDYAAAVYWWHEAAKQGDAIAQYNLGACYFVGKGVAKNLIETDYWWSKSAERGNANDQFKLANCFASGRDVKQDYVRAVYWWSKAAEQDYAMAKYNLWWMYASGEGEKDGIKQDSSEADRWYRKAVEHNDAGVLLAIARAYAKGNGIKQDNDRAARLYEQAYFLYRNKANEEYFTDESNEDAMRILAKAYENGEGVEQDNAEALRWYRKADKMHEKNEKRKLNKYYYNEHSEENEINKNQETPPNLGAASQTNANNSPKEFMDSDIILKFTNELLDKTGASEQNRPLIASTVVRFIELDHKNPIVVKAKLDAVNHMLSDEPGKAETSWSDRVAPQAPTEAAATEAKPQPSAYANVPPPPTEAPAKYADRPNKREGVDTFILKAYKAWIVDGADGKPVLMLPRKLIEQLDPACDRALTDWPGNHPGEEFPVKIARKGAAAPPAPALTEPLQQAWRNSSRTAYQKPPRPKEAGAGKAR